VSRLTIGCSATLKAEQSNKRHSILTPRAFIVRHSMRAAYARFRKPDLAVQRYTGHRNGSGRRMHTVGVDWREKIMTESFEVQWKTLEQPCTS
jgi:hypothetical protein